LAQAESAQSDCAQRPKCSAALPFSTQTMAARILLALCSVSGANAISSRFLASNAVASELNREWKSCQEAESEDTHFWSSELSAMETELLQLQAAVGGQPVVAATGKPAAAAAKPPKKNPRHVNPLAGLKLNLEPKTAADLVPALSMLKGLYEDGKERIGKLNAREQDSKKKFEAKQAQHEQRIAVINARLKNGSLSKEFGTNETRDENRLWTYWEHVRERQHRQYHTSLKIQHGTLSKEKQMIEMYEKTIAAKESKKQLAQEFRKIAGPQVAPEVVFMQQTKVAVARYCQEELAELRSSKAALLQMDSPSGHDLLH